MSTLVHITERRSTCSPKMACLGCWFYFFHHLAISGNQYAGSSLVLRHKRLGASSGAGSEAAGLC